MLGQCREDLCEFRPAPGLLLREGEAPVDEHVELALPALHHLRTVPRPVDLGRETRSPLVVPASDGAVEDAHVRHGRSLPVGYYDGPYPAAVSSRGIRNARALLVVALVAWFLSPPEWRYAVPLWLPFLVALALEVEFAVGGWLRWARHSPLERGRGPQRADLERFGWPGEQQPEDDDPAFWSSLPVPHRRSTGLRRVGASLAVIGFVALIAWGIDARRGWSGLAHGTRTHIERVLSREAAAIAGHPVRVRCDTQGRHVGAVQEADGVAEVGGRDAWLTPAICFQLYRVIDHHDTHSFSPTGRAIAVLAHEAWHLRGVADEGVTNCYAFQSGVAIGTRLGLTASFARALMREQLADNGADSASDPRYLVPGGCRDGGRYDLNPGSSPFP